MPTFVKVTNYRNEPLWVNLDQVISIGHREDGGANIHRQQGGPEVVDALRTKESPEQILGKGPGECEWRYVGP